MTTIIAADRAALVKLAKNMAAGHKAQLAKNLGKLDTASTTARARARIALDKLDTAFPELAMFGQPVVTLPASESEAIGTARALRAHITRLERDGSDSNGKLASLRDRLREIETKFPAALPPAPKGEAKLKALLANAAALKASTKKAASEAKKAAREARKSKKAA